MPLRQRLRTIIAFLCFFAVINSMLIFPIIFNYLLIPKIEKRIGQKLNFCLAMYNGYLFGKFFCRYIEIMYSILILYFRFKLTRNPKDKKLASFFALGQIDYQISTASPFEIIMSFLGLINAFVLLSGIVLYAVYFYN